MFSIWKHVRFDHFSSVAYPELVSGGFPKVENLSGWWRTVSVKSVTPWFKKKSRPGGVPGNQKPPPGYATALQEQLCPTGYTVHGNVNNSHFKNSIKKSALHFFIKCYIFQKNTAYYIYNNRRVWTSLAIHNYYGAKEIRQILSLTLCLRITRVIAHTWQQDGFVY